MHRREGAKFPWGKVLGWVIPIALIIIIIIARSNAGDDAERRNRAMNRTIMSSQAATQSAIQTQVATRVVPVLVIDGTVAAPRSSAATATPTEPADECKDLVGLDARVEDAIARSYEINFAAIEESSTPEEFIRRRPDAIRQVVQVWRDTAANSGAVPARLLGLIANIWEQNATIAADDAPAQARNLRSLADAYSNLATKFEQCESTKDFATDLRQEAQGMRELAGEFN